jgi:hypothetical protein
MGYTALRAADAPTSFPTTTVTAVMDQPCGRIITGGAGASKPLTVEGTAGREKCLNILMP